MAGKVIKGAPKAIKKVASGARKVAKGAVHGTAKVLGAAVDAPEHIKGAMKGAAKKVKDTATQGFNAGRFKESSTNLRNSIVDRLKGVYDSKMNEEESDAVRDRRATQTVGQKPKPVKPGSKAFGAPTVKDNPTHGRTHSFRGTTVKGNNPKDRKAQKEANPREDSSTRIQIVKRLKSVFESKMSDLDVQRQERKGGVQKFSTRLHMRRAAAAADRNAAKGGPAKLPGHDETKRGLDSLTLNKRK